MIHIRFLHPSPPPLYPPPCHTVSPHTHPLRLIHVTLGWCLVTQAQLPPCLNEPGEGNTYIHMAMQCASEILARKQTPGTISPSIHAISTQINATLTPINAILGTSPRRIVRSP